jgi:hypothetical protein
MIVASRRMDVARRPVLFSVVCSATFTEPIQDDEVRLPFSYDGQCPTKLTEDTVAVCNWKEVIPVSEVDRWGGIVPKALLWEVLEKAGVTTG